MHKSAREQLIADNALISLLTPKSMSHFIFTRTIFKDRIHESHRLILRGTSHGYCNGYVPYSSITPQMAGRLVKASTSPVVGKHTNQVDIHYKLTPEQVHEAGIMFLYKEKTLPNGKISKVAYVCDKNTVNPHYDKVDVNTIMEKMIGYKALSESEINALS